MESILITGIGNSLAIPLIEHLYSQYRIFGIDFKKELSFKKTNLTYFSADLRGDHLERIIKQFHIQKIIHLAVHHGFKLPEKLKHELNIQTAQQVIDTCIRCKVKKVILVSDICVYGALPETPAWLNENAPLNGSQIIKEHTSIVSVDHMFSELFWRAPFMEAIVLRPVNIVGKNSNRLLNQYLKLKYLPFVFGFNPLMQIIHEEDLARAIKTSLADKFMGKFNITGPGSLTISELAQSARIKRIPLFETPAKLITHFAYKLKKFPCPASTLSYFQNTLSLDGESFRNATAFKSRMGLNDIMDDIANY